MQAQLIGRVDKPACVVVSTWDPLLPTTRAYLQQVVAHACTHGQSAVAAVLDPPPQRYLRGAANWAVYMSFRARLHWLFEQGLDAAVRVDFRQSDLKLGVYDLLDLLRSCIPVAEIWTRPGQTLGPEARGSAMALALYAKKHAVTWKRPALPDMKVLGTTVRGHLMRGEIAAAQAIVGLPATWSRPEAGEFEIAWPSGRYVAIPETFDGTDGHAPITVELRDRKSVV